MSNYLPSRFSAELVSRLRGLIARFDVNQAELASLCHVSQSQFSKIIRGVRPITIDQVAVIAESLDLDLGKLIEEVDTFVAHDAQRTSPVVFVENERKLESPYRRQYDILDDWGQKSAFEYDTTDFDVSGSDDTDEPRQSDYERAALEDDGNEGIEH